MLAAGKRVHRNGDIFNKEMYFKAIGENEVVGYTENVAQHKCLKRVEFEAQIRIQVLLGPR